ncbi:MAG: hypothetical protein IJ119_10265 [Clostridia bacterium]|nr:hypothetical protein [Clostridia bacterium]
MDLDTIGRWLGWVVMAGYVVLTATEVPRYFISALKPAPAIDAPAARRLEGLASRRRLMGEVLVAFALSRLLVVLVCAVGYWITEKSLSGFFPALWENLFPWDARHYLDIIDSGYVAEGEARLFIVFFPFYPMLGRCLTLMTGISSTAAGLIVSNAALVGCGAAMYRLAEIDGGPTLGRRAMLLLMFCPMTYFFSITYSESAFLLVTLLAVLFARRRRFFLAVLFGALASGARLLGMATAIPIFWELLRDCREKRGDTETPVTPGEYARWILVSALKVLPVSLGFLGYLSLNWHLFGNATQFMVFQREHWYQEFGHLGNTFQYCLYNSVIYDDPFYQLGVWRPQLLLLVAVPLLVLLRRKRARPGDVAYTLVYHYVSFAPTWLLSGPRYAACNYALYPMLADIPKRRRGFAVMLAAECALLAYMTWIGLWLGKVY